MKKENENISWSLLAKDVSGELTEKEHQLLQQELADNADIEKQVKKLWGDAHYAQALKDIDSDKAWNTVRSQIHTPAKISVFRKYGAIAAILAVLLSSAVFFNLFTGPKDQVITTAETLEQVTLPDGTTVDLNYGSTLVFPKQFTGQSRTVKLNGEAFFDVTRNVNMPFIIETEQLNIRVLGTSFNVKAYPGAEHSEVVVSTGKVSVNAKNLADKVVLEAGDAVNYTVKGNSMETHKVFTNNYKAWKTQELEFKNTKLSEVIKTIEQTYHIDIQVDSNITTDDKLFNATFSQYSLEHVLESVCASFNLQYSRKGAIYQIENSH